LYRLVHEEAIPTRDTDDIVAVIAADLEPLRSRFEADSGKVRAILLASPT
jgi:hypothetical protein